MSNIYKLIIVFLLLIPVGASAEKSGVVDVQFKKAELRIWEKVIFKSSDTQNEYEVTPLDRKLRLKLPMGKYNIYLKSRYNDIWVDSLEIVKRKSDYFVDYKKYYKLEDLGQGPFLREMENGDTLNIYSSWIGCFSIGRGRYFITKSNNNFQFHWQDEAWRSIELDDCSFEFLADEESKMHNQNTRTLYHGEIELILHNRLKQGYTESFPFYMEFAYKSSKQQ